MKKLKLIISILRKAIVDIINTHNAMPGTMANLISVNICRTVTFTDIKKLRKYFKIHKAIWHDKFALANDSDGYYRLTYFENSEFYYFTSLMAAVLSLAIHGYNIFDEIKD